MTLGRQVDLKLVTGSGEAFRLPALVTVFWDFTSTYSRLNQSGDENTTVHLASKASHGYSDSHTHRVHCNAFLLTCLRNTIITLTRSHCARYNIPFRRRNCFLSFRWTNSSPPARISQSYCDFFRFALPTDRCKTPKIKPHQSKQNHTQTN